MAKASVNGRVSNLHTSVLHAKVGPFGHADEEARLHHT